MKLRLITGLAAALVLSGCATYDYVGHGGGYYTGSSPQYSRSGYGSAYGSYGYGSAYGYRYRPGWSFGLDYAYPYSYYPYGSGYYGGGYYPQRPPYYRPYPPRPPRPGDHQQQPEQPERPPPVAGSSPPPLNRAPWRDIERLRRGEANGEPPPRAQPGTNAFGGDAGPTPDSVPFPGGRAAGLRPQPPTGLSPDAGMRPQPSFNPGRQNGSPRFSGEGDGARARYQEAPRGGEQRIQRAPRPSPPAESSRPMRSETRDTIEP